MPRTEVTGRQIKDATVSLEEDVTGVLSVANGGSGSNTIALNNVVLGNGSGAVQTVAPGQSGNILTSNGTTWVSSAPATGSGSGDVTSAETASVDGEVVVFNSTTGKSIRAATATGIAKLESGVLSTVSAPAGDLVGTSATQTLTGKTISGADNTLTNIAQASVVNLTTDLAGKESTANRNAANGYCGLDSSGKVAAAQLPSYVDDILEFSDLASFPATGESGKIYVDLATNRVHRWSGAAYIEISPSPGSTDGVAEGSTNLYFTNARADARIAAAVGTTVQGYDADLAAFANKTAPSGAVVGTTDSQTLESKTLTNPTINGYTEGVLALGTVGASATLSIIDDSVITATLTASTATTFTMPPVGAGKSFLLFLRQAATTGNGTATFTGVKWGTTGAPTVTATAGRMDIFSFLSDGTNWYGSVTQGFTP